MNDTANQVQAHTIRLELVDEPGELMRALEPVSENGGNLLSIFHKRGHITPRGYIPVEVDIEATPERYADIVNALRKSGIKVVQAGTERYSESVTVLLSGHLVDTDLSDTLNQIGKSANTTVKELSLSAPKGTRDVSSARVQLATAEGKVDETLDMLRTIAAEKDLQLIEPLTLGGSQ